MGIIVFGLICSMVSFTCALFLTALTLKEYADGEFGGDLAFLVFVFCELQFAHFHYSGQFFEFEQERIEGVEVSDELHV